MENPIGEDDLRAMLVRMGAAWDRADGVAFAAAFAEDADFVNILGASICGREAIAMQHQAIFDTIYRGSHAVFELVKLRRLSADVAVAQISATLDAPGGPRPGTTKTLATAAIARVNGGWSIASFQNTVIAQLPG